MKEVEQKLKTSVIISTYNSPKWLQKVLWGFLNQTSRDFEILIADDGSKPETEKLIREISKASPVAITSVWQPDEGFQKSRILNKAIAVAKGERILVTDGDCVPRADFVEVHTNLANPKCFLSGSYFKLPIKTSEAMNLENINNGNAFKSKWLIKNHLPLNDKIIKLIIVPPIDRLLNKLSPARPTWNGHSASCLRNQVLEVNGFNEDMQYGGQDVEFGLRLNHIGLNCRRIRYSAITMHLYHGHGYTNPEMINNSEMIKERTRSNRLKWTTTGIDQWISSEGSAKLGKDDRVTVYNR